LPELLFAYGTLGPAGPAVEGWTTDRVRGRLFDLGPYPALVDWADPLAGWVDGHVRTVSLSELEEQLDPYEGVSEGLFARLALPTEKGRLVWVYVYPHPLPPGARGPLARWDRVLAVDPPAPSEWPARLDS
jgi:gamma-glutamylcyclotransferase (GGCT)/AIG2-like uncharacterized protein YtfP